MPPGNAAPGIVWETRWSCHALGTLGALGTRTRPQPPAEERVAWPSTAEGAHGVETGHFKGHQGVEVRGMQHLGSCGKHLGRFHRKNIYHHTRFSTPSSNATGHIFLLYSSKICLVWGISFPILKTCNGSLAYAVLPKVPEHPLP